MMPPFAGRMGSGWDQMRARTPEDHKQDVLRYPLTKRPIHYFRMMYAHSAMFGAVHVIRCSIGSYGVDRLLFASDTPCDPDKGPGYVRATIKNLGEIGLTGAEKQAIYTDNACRLLGLDVVA